MLPGLLILLLCTHSAINGQNIAVFPKDPTGLENENLEIRVTNSAVFTLCSFSVYSLVVNKNKSEPGTEYWENEERTECKLLFKPLKNNFKGKWTVTISDSMSTTKNASFSVFMDEAPKPPADITISAVIGSKFSHPCVFDKLYGKIFRPDGSLADEGPAAAIYLPFVRLQDSGAWTCVVQLRKSIAQAKFNLYLNVTSKETVQSSVEDLTDKVNLLCHYVENSSPCLFESPNGTIIAPREGVYTERYHYYGKGVDHDCGLTIIKPLQSGEVGIWKCMISSTEHSSFLVVGDKKQTSISSEMQSVSVVAGMNLTIHCTLRQPLTYCYVRSPLGTIFSSMESDLIQTAQYTGLGLGQGDCKITINGSYVTTNETGFWMCGMGTEQAVDDIQVPIHVRIAASQFSAESQVKDGDIGGKLNLRCRSVMSYGLSYCRFTHPTGRSLNLGINTSVDGFAYFGRGLDSGECGISIDKLKAQDLGTWTCAARFIGEQWSREFQDRIQLSESPIRSETLIGMSVVLGLLAMGLIGGLIFWEKKRRSRRGPNIRTADGMYIGARIRLGSNGSGDSEIVGPSPARSTPDSHSS